MKKWCCYRTVDPETPAPHSGASHYCAFLNKACDRMVLSLNCCFYYLVILTTFGTILCHAWFWVNEILSKSLFFPDRTEWCSFPKFPYFSCNRCVKRVFYSAFVRKCTVMCKHRFGVQLLQNPPLCSSTDEIHTVRIATTRPIYMYFVFCRLWPIFPRQCLAPNCHPSTIN